MSKELSWGGVGVDPSQLYGISQFSEACGLLPCA